jgi:hypothetical protein
LIGPANVISIADPIGGRYHLGNHHTRSIAMFSWYTGLPWKLRLGLALAVLLVSTIILLCGYFWIWGFGAGVILFLFAFPNDAEKRGYHDF